MLDLQTLRLVSMVSFGCFTFANFFLWRLVPQERGLRDFALASMAIAVALMLFGLYGIIPDFFSRALGNALLTLGIGLVYIGTRNLLGFSPGFSWHWLAAATVFFLCLIASSVAVRVVAISTLIAPFLSASAWLFWHSKREPRLQTTKRIMALILAVGAMLFLLRALNPPSTSLSIADFVNTASGVEVAPYIYAIVMSMWMPVTLLLIVSVRLQNQRVELLAQDELINRKLHESEERYRTLIDWSPNAIAVHRKGVLLYVNPATVKLFGAYSAQALIGKHILNLTHPDSHLSVLDRKKASTTTGATWSSFEEKFLRLDGTPIDVEYQSTAISYEGEPAIHTAIRDVTARMQADSELRIAAIAFESEDGMLVTDVNNVILRVNSAFTRITGYTALEAIGQTPQLLSSGRHDASFYAAMWETLYRTGAWHGEIWNRRKSGEVYPEQLTITSVKGNTGQVTHYIATWHDITERKQLEETVRQLAFYDPLTRLPNRRLFNDRLAQSLTRAKREQSRMALMFIDLDKFKPINDNHGHEAGDWVLEAVARRLESCLRASDTAARVGGDEFLILLPDVLTPADAYAVAEKIRIELERPFITPSQLVLRASSSIGIAVYPDHANTEPDLLRLGDRAMYQAKNLGGNSVQIGDLSTEPEDTDDISAAGQSIVRLTWKAAFTYGQPTIDNEHRKLFRLSNVLLGKVTTRAEEPDQFDAAFDALLTHIVEHFAHEEAIMLAHSYEHLEEHAKIHQALVAQALKLRHPPSPQTGVSVGELVDFLESEVVVRHMLVEDRKFSSLFTHKNVRLTGES